MRRQSIAAHIAAAIRVLDPWIEYRRSLARVPGVSVGIVYDGQIVFRKGYGSANLARRTPALDTTCYRIASISKTFTATALMQLVEAGACQLDDRVQKFLPWFRSTNDRRLSMITLRHLLTHMAGVERDGNTAHWVNDRFPTRRQLRAYVGAGTIVYRPLESFKYSNVGYAVLGEVIAAITGETYEQYVNTHIIRRLRLTHTSPTLTPAVRRYLAGGYGRDVPPRPRAALPHAETLAMTPAAGLTSNVVDLCRYMSAQFLANPVLLSDESKREMQRIHWLNEKRGSHYGIGYDIWKVGDKQIVGHGGAFSGFITRIGMDLDAKIGVAVLTNALDPLAVILVNGVFSTLHHFAQPGALRASRRRVDLARYEGCFSSRWGDTIVVQVGRRLIAFAPQNDRPMDDSVVLRPIGGHAFKIATGSEFGYLGENAVFGFDRRGKLAGLTWGPNPMTLARAPVRMASRARSSVDRAGDS